MGPALRLCLVLESTARAGAHWQSGAVLRYLIEPLLALVEAAPGGCELALVCFGAHAPHSAAAVESSLGWWSGGSVAQFRTHLLDSLTFSGGGGQAVALAEALLEAASLFACPPAVSGGGAAGAAPACQQHCLVFLASDPAPQPVTWPFPEDCCMAKLPGLATSAELCHTLRRRGVLLGLAGSSALLSSSQQLWHVANLASDAPISLESARWDRLKRQHGGELVQQQLMRSVVSLPGGGYATLPFWPQALEALQQKAGGRLLSAALAASRAAGTLPVVGGDSLEPVADSEELPAKHARTTSAVAGRPASAAGGASALGLAGNGLPTGMIVPGAAPPAGAGAAAPLASHAGTPPMAAAVPAVPTPLAAVLPSPEGPPVVQWTPPGTAATQQATPPVAASPGSFWEVLNAEILSPAEAESMPVPVPAVHTPRSTPHEPAVQGLPLPPVQQAQQQAAPPRPQLAMAAQQPMAQPVPVPHLQRAQPPHAQHAGQQPRVLPGMLAGGGAVGGAPPPAAAAPSPASPHAGVGGTHGRYALVHSCRVVVDQRVTRSSTLLLGMGQVWALQSEAAALSAVSWPQELHVAKALAHHTAKSVLASKPGCRQTRLRMTYATPEAEALPGQLLEAGLVGIAALGSTALGVLFPMRHPQGHHILLNLAVVPNGKAA
ncbi:hypothetical protein ABPG77_002845 [Micractinium sp. CCAP 211/92]